MIEHDSVQDKQMVLKSHSMVWYGKYGMLCDFNAMIWDFYAMLCYGLCCKR